GGAAGAEQPAKSSGRQERGRAERSGDPGAAPRGGGRPNPSGAGFREVRLNVGVRDGVDGEFVAQWLGSRLGLAAGDLGEVRVRERATFIDVPAGRVADAVAALTGLRFGGRDVVAAG
ncbi:MAG: DbpA RNA binding domain-containing protein, partial [Myxococcota bacterium]|nr:DbpA RNA binding domain-containing protein [Myxococcota bacterium]